MTIRKNVRLNYCDCHKKKDRKNVNKFYYLFQAFVVVVG